MTDLHTCDECGTAADTGTEVEGGTSLCEECLDEHCVYVVCEHEPDFWAWR